MREILFRAKAISTGCFVYGSLIKKALTANSTVVDYGIARDGCYPFEVCKNTLGQYTGLKDKNGTKIFEGDRVLITGQGSIPDYEAIIYFELGRFAVKGKFCQDTSMIHFLSSETIEDFEIIGNIHEVEK